MTHSPGAIRAAHSILKTWHLPARHSSVAEIIDRETGVKALLEALKDIARGDASTGEMPSMSIPITQFRSKMWAWAQKHAADAIAKHKGDAA